MRRILEKLAQERQEKEEQFSAKIRGLKDKQSDEGGEAKFERSQTLLARLEEFVHAKKPSPRKIRRGIFLRSSKKEAAGQQPLNELLLEILSEQQSLLLFHLKRINESLQALPDLISLESALADARDREWDALGNNHVSMIFKSLEWRVEKLASEYEDVKILMNKFLLLKEKLDRLLSVLEEKKMPSPAHVREILEPLEDWRYAGFENRFRGEEEEVKNQLRTYLNYFATRGKVVDLGCGRGEFLELLKEQGTEAVGIDSNDQMIAACRDKGLACEKGDILEALSNYEDGSLAGIFSSQVVEHLAPPYLKRMLELAHIKLAPGGTVVLETINPCSVFALVQIYYLDLSHRTPLHPRTMKFLLETAGFEDVKVRLSPPLGQERLQNLPRADEFSAILNRNIDSLNELLYAPPNYAVIGRKR